LGIFIGSCGAVFALTASACAAVGPGSRRREAKAGLNAPTQRKLQIKTESIPRFFLNFMSSSELTRKDNHGRADRAASNTNAREPWRVETLENLEALRIY
jgi:hypothetical protein